MVIGIRRGTAIPGIRDIGLVRRTKVQPGFSRAMRVACIIRATGTGVTGKWDMTTAGIATASGVMTTIAATTVMTTAEGMAITTATSQIRRTGWSITFVSISC